MSWEHYDENCPGCRPRLLDLKSKRPLPENHPTMRTVLQVWEQTTRNEREAYHRVMCQNSRHWFDLDVVERICQRIQQATREKVLQ